MKWNNYVINYSLEDQRERAVTLRKGFVAARFKVDDLIYKIRAKGKGIFVLSFKFLKGYSSSFGILIILLVIIFPMLFLFSKTGLWNFRKGEAPELKVQFYLNLLKILAGKGIRKEPWQTPMEFALSSCPMAKDEVASLTDLYYQVRFGEKRLLEEEALYIKTVLMKLKDL